MENDQFMLTITANEITSTDPDFTLKNLSLGDLYKPIDTYYRKANGDSIRRQLNKGERKISNQTMAKLAFQIFEKSIDGLSKEEKLNFPVCQYTEKTEMLKGIYESEEAFKQYKNTLEFLVYKRSNGEKYVIYTWNIFTTILFIKECVKRFGQEGDTFILTYRKKEVQDAGGEGVVPVEPDVIEVFFDNFATGGINRIYYGAPGTGKSWAVKEFVSQQYNKSWRTTFHPEYNYFDFVGGLKPIQNKETGRISYEYYPGPFTESLIYAYKHPTEKVALIVEEINRANTAAVFGDVFQLLDRDETGKSEYGIHNREVLDYLENEHGIILPNNNILIPPNFSLIATMNSADQGVFVMDSAFKRRWEFEYVPIDFENHSDVGDLTLAGMSITWQHFVDQLNDHLSSIGIPEDKLIGPRFLNKKDIQSKDKIAAKLLIYLWDDVVRYKRDALFKEHLRFSKVVEEYSTGRQIFVKELHDGLNSASDKDNNTISEV